MLTILLWPICLLHLRKKTKHERNQKSEWVSWRQHISLYLTKFSMPTKRMETTGNILSYCRTGSLMHAHTNFHDPKYYTPLVHSTSYLSSVSAPFPAPLICTHLSKCHCFFLPEFWGRAESQHHINIPQRKGDAANWELWVHSLTSPLFWKPLSKNSYQEYVLPHMWC